MARVFLAHDEVLDRDAALKILRDQYAESEEFVERFRREAQSAAALNHPNIVSVYDWGRSEDGTYYMAMECVSGGTLKDRIVDKGLLDPSTTAELGSQVAEALGFAHERGVIHRDVKPQNILLAASGDVKVADFGIARAVGAMASTAISQSGLVLGTASYISPEQAMGEPAGPQSDLYSLGVVLYEMLTGKVPYEAENPVALCMKHVNELPRPPKEVNPGVPEAMNTIVLRLLDKKPENRYASAAELAEDLRRVHGGLSTLVSGAVTVDLEATRIYRQTKEPASPGTVALRSMARRRGRAKLPRISAAAFLLVALLGGAGWNLSGHVEGLDLASIIQGLQRQDSSPSPGANASEVLEEAEQPADAKATSAEDSTRVRTSGDVVSADANFGQSPPIQAAAVTASALPSDTSPEPQPTSQQAPEQPDPTPPSSNTKRKDAQPAAARQGQTQVVSSQTSGGGGQDRRTSNIQVEQRGGQVKNPRKPSGKH